MNNLNIEQIIQLIKDTHPRPSQVTLKQAAEMLNVSEPTARKLVRAGELKPNNAGMIPIAEIDKYCFARAA